MISGLHDLSAPEVLLAVEHARERELSAQADTMALAAHWCDLHGGVGFDAQGRARVGDEKLVMIGGDGTPAVEEFAAAEFGAMRHQHPGAARNLMADALDLRHRLPHVWEALLSLRVEVWVARKIASLTRALDREGAAYVDAALADALGSLPVGRLLTLVEAKVIEADPELAEQRRKAAEAARFVRTTKDGNGMMVLIARATAGDLIVLEAMVNRIAEILAEQGDDDPVDVRRSKALGLLARPADALRLLLGAAHAAGVPDDEAEAAMTGDRPTQDEPTNHGPTTDRPTNHGPTTDRPTNHGPTTDRPTNHEPTTDRPTTERRPSLRDLLVATGLALRPRATLFVHVSQDALAGTHDGPARVEGLGPVTLEQVREWLGHARVSVRPVLDPAGIRPVDGYEVPRPMREALQQISPADTFPWSDRMSRQRDADHSAEYVPVARGGPPGQTGLHNLGPLVRHHHRIKTFSRWRVTCLSPGRYLWRSPHGFHFLVDQDGTHRIPAELESAFGTGDDAPRLSLAELQLAKVLMRHLRPAA